MNFSEILQPMRIEGNFFEACVYANILRLWRTSEAN
jgi:hypothetical protein